jgi:hypothetical protein
MTMMVLPPQNLYTITYQDALKWAIADAGWLSKKPTIIQVPDNTWIWATDYYHYPMLEYRYGTPTDHLSVAIAYDSRANVVYWCRTGAF